MWYNTSSKQHNIPASDVNIPESRIKYDVLLDAKEVGNSSNSLFTPRVVVGRYLEIFHLGEGESTVLLRTNWEMSLTLHPLTII